ncbi:MAG: ABC transporter substrate-binding protein [Filifactoraceae bacterium]
MKVQKNLFSKKIISLSLASMLVLGGCSTNDKTASLNQSPTSEAKTFKIGISQLAEHPALDQVREGFLEELNNSGLSVQIDYKNAQGDIANASSISSKFVADKVDMILGIATISAQAAKQSTTEIPVLFSAVTDPISAGLVDNLDSPNGNVTGTTDQTPIKEQLELFKQLDPNIKKIGILFNPSEANSMVQIEEATKLASTLGLEIISLAVNNVNEIPQAIDSILSKSDALYTITDNTVASAIGSIAIKAIEQKKIVIGSENSHVQAGVLMTNGINYKDLGKQTAKMAISILKDGRSPREIKVERLTHTTKTVNKKTVEALNLDSKLEVFKNSTIIE